MKDPAGAELPEGARFEPVLEAVERAAQGILDEAQSEAERRVGEAEARAERIARERAAEVSRVSDELLALADRVRAKADELLAAIDDALADLGERADRPVEAADADSEDPDTWAGGAAPPSAEPTSEEVKRESPISALRERFGRAAQAPRQVPIPPREAPRRSMPPAAAPRPRRVGSAGSGATEREGSAASEGAILLATQMAVSGATRDQIESRLRDDFGIEDPSAILERIGA